MNFFIINSFSYEYGKKLPDGSWSGLVGDLTSGNIDLVVADMTMVRIMRFLFCLNSLRFFFMRETDEKNSEQF